RRGRRCTGTSTGGRKTRSPSGCWSCCVVGCVSPRAAQRSPAQGSLTRRVSRVPIRSASPLVATTRTRRSTAASGSSYTLGLLLVVCVMAASVQDRDGAKTTLLSLYLFTPVRFVYADAGFAGVLVDWCRRILRTALEIVRKDPGQKGFAVIAR